VLNLKKINELVYGPRVLEDLTVRAVTQDIPGLLCNTQVHYRAHKSPQTASILNRVNPTHTVKFYFPKTHLNIIPNYA
jgi:hypothetical protein